MSCINSILENAQILHQLRYHIIDLPGVLGNNVLGSYNCSYDFIRCIKKCLDDIKAAL